MGLGLSKKWVERTKQLSPFTRVKFRPKATKAGSFCRHMAYVSCFKALITWVWFDKSCSRSLVTGDRVSRREGGHSSTITRQWQNRSTGKKGNKRSDEGKRTAHSNPWQQQQQTSKRNKEELAPYLLPLLFRVDCGNRTIKRKDAAG